MRQSNVRADLYTVTVYPPLVQHVPQKQLISAAKF
jgi:hypothetical protein